LGAKEWNNSLKTKLSLLPKKLFRIRMSRNFGMKMLTMTNLSTECLIQLTKLGYDATPFNQILKQIFKIVVIDIQITLKQMLRDFIGIRVNRAKKSGMVNITSSVNSRERSGINTILHELNPLFTINVTMRDIKSKNVY